MNADRKVAVVTGASQGLGEGIVNAFRERNYRVVGTSRSINTSDDPDYVTIAGDIGDPATGRKVIETALARFGRVDTLVNNAGIFIASEFTKYSDQQYKDMLSTNLNGFFYITQHTVEAMLKQGSGLMPPLISVERCTEKKNRETGSGFLKRLDMASLAFE